MQNSVFECPGCRARYDEADHKPLSLPCGHVYCLHCLQGQSTQGATFCPADRTRHSAPVSDLPCCFAILSNLPKAPVKSQSKCLCKRHPTKKIKFMCESHHAFLCSACVLEHTGTGHSIVPFTACSCTQIIIDRHR